MRELFEESWVTANEPKGGDSEAKELLPIGDGLGGDVGCRGAVDGIPDEESSLEVGVGVDDVV